MRINIGEKIKYLRKKRMLTQKQLAQISEVSQTHLSQVENGKKEFGIVALRRIANALQTDFYNLVDTKNFEGNVKPGLTTTIPLYPSSCLISGNDTEGNITSFSFPEHIIGPTVPSQPYAVDLTNAITIINPNIPPQTGDYVLINYQNLLAIKRLFLKSRGGELHKFDPDQVGGPSPISFTNEDIENNTIHIYGKIVFLGYVPVRSI